MANQQKGVQQDTAYSASLTLAAHARRGLMMHYKQYLVALLFADLPSLSPFIS